MSTTESVIATSLLLAVALITNLAYLTRHRRDYGAGREKANVTASFSPLTDKYLRLSTFSLGLLSCWGDRASLLQPLKGGGWFVAGGSIVVLAEALFVWSMISLGRQYSPCYDSFIPKAIVTRGPYRYVRHPIYTANVLLLLGIALLSGTLLLVPNLLVLGVGYYRSAVQEESYLCANLPKYRGYRQRTGMFLPRLWPAPTSKPA
jgi:protein-S-isoprenylcysteine O-methyltransferase Ste14